MSAPLLHHSDNKFSALSDGGGKAQRENIEKLVSIVNLGRGCALRIDDDSALPKLSKLPRLIDPIDPITPHQALAFPFIPSLPYLHPTFYFRSTPLASHVLPSAQMPNALKTPKKGQNGHVSAKS